MASVKVFNKFDTEPVDNFEIDSTLRAWLIENIEGYEDTTQDPFSAKLNGLPWRSFEQELSVNDVIELTLEPQEVTTWLWAIYAIAIGYSLYVANSIPTGYENSTPDGNSIYSPNAQFNRAKPNGIIRKNAGIIPTYPDLICPVRRYYDNHEEFLLVNLCVQVGYSNANLSNLYIAETPIINYSGDVLAQFKLPGEDVSGHEAHENWYESKEVSNLKLSTEASTTQIGGNWTLDITSNTMRAYVDASPVDFPHNVDEHFEITTAAYEGWYRVDAIDSQVATITKVNRIHRFEEGVWLGPFYVPVETNLTPATGVAVNWNSNLVNSTVEGPHTVTPEYELTETLEFDVNFANGLTRINDDGYFRDRTVEILIQWREVGTATWNTVPNTTFTSQGLDERGYTIRVDLGAKIRPEVQFQRITPDANDTKISDEVRIKRVKAKLETRTTYPDVTTLQLKLRGTNALAQTAENKINIRGASNMLPTLQNLRAHIENGTPLVFEATRSIMRFAAYSIWDVSRQNLINWGVAEALDVLLEGRGDHLDADFSDEITLWEALKIILLPGYCEPSNKEGLFTPVRFAATDDYNYLYTPDQISNYKEVKTFYKPNEPKGIIAEYLDPVSGKNETINCFVAGDAEARAKRIQLKGVTDRERAYRLGMRERYRLLYKPKTISFQTTTAALNSDYGSADAVVSPLDKHQTFSAIAHRTENGASVLTLDGGPVFEVGEVYHAVFRKPDGMYSGMFEIEAGTNADEIVLVSPSTLGFDIVTDPQQTPTTCSIANESDFIKRIRIRNIKPADGKKVNVTAEEYVSQIHQNDNAELEE